MSHSIDPVTRASITRALSIPLRDPKAPPTASEKRAGKMIDLARERAKGERTGIGCAEVKTASGHACVTYRMYDKTYVVGTHAIVNATGRRGDVLPALATLLA